MMRRPCADREEKRLTRGSAHPARKQEQLDLDGRKQEQLDLDGPNQRGLLASGPIGLSSRLLGTTGKPPRGIAPDALKVPRAHKQREVAASSEHCRDVPRPR